MNASNIKNIIEAALMVSTQPLSLDKLQALFAKDAVQPDRDVLRNTLNELAEECNGRGVELREVASGWRYQVRADYAEWVNRMWEEKPPRYSRALLETLAIIAYRQPITRGEIEDIRGVGVSANIIRTLQERGWIKSVGHRDVPGKPELLATTREFLDYFNLKKLSDLPTLAEIRDLDEINPDLFAGFDSGRSQADSSEEIDNSELSEGSPGAETEEEGAAASAGMAEDTSGTDDTDAAEAEAEEASATAEQIETEAEQTLAQAEQLEQDAAASAETDTGEADSDDEDTDDDNDKIVQFSK